LCGRTPKLCRQVQKQISTKFSRFKHLSINNRNPDDLYVLQFEPEFLKFFLGFRLSGKPSVSDEQRKRKKSCKYVSQFECMQDWRNRMIETCEKERKKEKKENSQREIVSKLTVCV
jgi:hypothetical protein